MKELVSVCMLAYNHERWIDKAIESIVSQKTDFSFKLYINDDASTDGTQSIIKKWAEKYPNIIVPILQEDNQTSKGVKITPDILAPAAQGKYIALCEGDDYWIDPLKIQKQVSYLESHPKCTLSFSNANIVDLENRYLKKFITNEIWKDMDIIKKFKNADGCDFSISEMILLDFIPTASLVFSKEAFQDIYQYSYSLDLLFRLVTCNRGYAHYHNECLAAYRTSNPNSASGIIQNSKSRLKEKFYDLHCAILDSFDSKTNFKYHDIIDREKKRKEVIYYMKIADFKRCIKCDAFKEMKGVYFTKNFLRYRCSFIFNMIKKLYYLKK